MDYAGKKKKKSRDDNCTVEANQKNELQEVENDG